jgi:hypothetical protein
MGPPPCGWLMLCVSHVCVAATMCAGDVCAAAVVCLSDVYANERRRTCGRFDEVGVVFPVGGGGGVFVSGHGIGSESGERATSACSS